MKSSKKMIALSLFFVMLIALAGCSEGEKIPTSTENNSEQSGNKILKLSNVFTADQPLNITLQEVAENINKRTNGSIEIQIYPNGEIANSQDGVEQVIRGSDFISVDSPSNMSSWVPDFDALLGPMIYQSQEEYSQLVQTDLVKGIVKEAEGEGIKILSLDYTFGFRSLISNTPINDPNDLKGKKWRVPKSQLWVDTFSAMGANPITTAWSEVYSGLSSGVIDGLETSLGDMLDNQLQEIAKNVSLTRHFLGTTGVMISTEVWDSFTDEERKIMEEEFLEGAVRNNERIKELEENAQQELENAGVKFNEVDVDAFEKITESVFTKNPKLSPNIYENIKSELEKIRAN